MIAVPRAYVDHDVVSGRAKGDLTPAEMGAVTKIFILSETGKISLRTSSELTRQELGAYRDSEKKGKIEKVIDGLKTVAFQVAEWREPWGLVPSVVVFWAHPPAAEEFAQLRRIGLSRMDAWHLMLAIRDGCDVFVTCDERTILRFRSQIEAQFPRIKLRKPSEFISEFEGAAR